jgi:hypothetical protein
MMGRLDSGQDKLFYSFNLDNHVPQSHLLRGIDHLLDLRDLRQHLAPFYSPMGRPSIDPELMIRMLIVGYCFGIRCRATSMRRGSSEPRIPLVLPVRSGGRRTRTLDVLKESPRALPR